MTLRSWPLEPPISVIFTPLDASDIPKDPINLMLKSVFDLKGKTYLKGIPSGRGSVVAFDTARFVGGCFFLENGESMVCRGANAETIRKAIENHLSSKPVPADHVRPAYIGKQDILDFDKAATKYKKPLSVNPAVVSRLVVFLLIVATFWVFLVEFVGRDKPMSSAMVRVQQEKLIRAQLVDPDSARFTEQFHGKREGTWCGSVNAKNSFGGYTGNQRFIALSSVGFIESSMSVSEFEDLWASACR